MVTEEPGLGTDKKTLELFSSLSGDWRRTDIYIEEARCVNRGEKAMWMVPLLPRICFRRGHMRKSC